MLKSQPTRFCQDTEHRTREWPSSDRSPASNRVARGFESHLPLHTAQQRRNVMRRSELLRDVLYIVNEARYEMGLDPLQHLPSGVPGNAFKCPLAYALEEHPTVFEDRVLVPPRMVGALLSAWRTRAVFDKYYSSPAVILPGILKKFVKLFDARQIPELIERRETEALEKQRPAPRKRRTARARTAPA
jgi:hypothetical protein